MTKIFHLRTEQISEELHDRHAGMFAQPAMDGGQPRGVLGGAGQGEHAGDIVDDDGAVDGFIGCGVEFDGAFEVFERGRVVAHAHGVIGHRIVQTGAQ